MEFSEITFEPILRGTNRKLRYKHLRSANTTIVRKVSFPSHI